ncbi:hypothetical protein EVG20_g6462 [Dentipellis fragilis]|uniref:ribonuclease H n=1 Tax=Dentipellis fragilis TaxID=205917 RepID=A0A4Y9YPW2_9AGAM|nr:hypothetical protein EVG20_g6462 [Dentipellis fragilis]
MSARGFLFSDDDIDDEEDEDLTAGAADVYSFTLPPDIGSGIGPESHVPSPSRGFRSRRPIPQQLQVSSEPITHPQRIFLPPTPFTPPTDLFRPLATSQVHDPRYVAYGLRNMVLVYSGGSCLYNGTPQARAGCAFIYNPDNPDDNPKFRLENMSTEPGVRTRQTNNRAELRAAIAALDCTAWEWDGFTRVVIASNSQYLVAGITRHIWRWKENGWITSRGSPVCNQDLWTRLLNTVKKLEQRGVQPMFWRIPQEWTASVTDRAREAVSLRDTSGGQHELYTERSRRHLHLLHLQQPPDQDMAIFSGYARVVTEYNSDDDIDEIDNDPADVYSVYSVSIGNSRNPPEFHIPSSRTQVVRRLPPRGGETSMPVLQPIIRPRRNFVPPTPSATPISLFSPIESQWHGPRYVYNAAQDTMLIYCGASCLNNGSAYARAGCAFIYHPSDPSANPLFRLETVQGQDGLNTRQTNNRAELRAALAALRYARWEQEGFARIVIASSSQYLVSGMARYVQRWRRNDWINSRGNPICNKDLWEDLVDVVEWWEGQGVQPMFWRIPREWTVSVMDRARQAAATLPDVHGHVHI